MAIKKNITKLSDLEQINGRDQRTEMEPTSLDALFGGSGLGKYSTSDTDEYINQLNNFNTAELRNHAIKIGLIPIVNINRLKKQLVTEFNKFTLVAKNNTKPKSRVIDVDKQSAALKVMAGVK